MCARDYKGFGTGFTTMNGVIEVMVENKPKRLGNLYGEDKGTGYAGNVWDIENIAPTLTTSQGGQREPMITESQIKVCESQIAAMRGRNPDNPSDRTVGNAGGNSYLYNVGYHIRKLTPRECGRLMGVSDEDITKMEKVNSNSQLYKQFGNSIVVDVMVAIFEKLNIEQEK